MLREYLDEILDGKKTYDTRSYDTNKRGTIALVDTKKSAIIGLVDLVGTHKISAEEYCKWHATGKWEGMELRVDDMSKTYYAYDFKSPRMLEKPIKIVKTGRMWTKIDDSLLNGARFKSHLYETHTEIGDTTYIVRSVAPGTDDEKVIQEKVKRLILNNAKDVKNKK